MRNDSWHGGRYTEYRESREKDSLWWIGRDPNVGVDPLSFLKLPVKSIDARLIKVAYESCGLPFTKIRRTLQILPFQEGSRTRAALDQRCQAAIKAVRQYGQVIQVTRKTRLRTPHATINEGET